MTDTRPGMGIIRKVMPDASAEEQEAAYGRLRHLLKTMIRITRERYEQESDSRKSRTQDRIQSSFNDSQP
jgi:hypothetical protein